MVNRFNPPVENTDLNQQLETTKLELLRTQARLHQLQETSIAEAVFLQLRSQYFQAQYELWIFKACVAWAKGEISRTIACLESSLDCTGLEAQSVIADWLKRLDQFAKEGQIANANALELEALMDSPEWYALTERAVSG